MWLLGLCLILCAGQMPHMWWHFDATAGYQMVASPVFNADSSALFVGSQDQNLYAVNAATGAPLWNFNTNSLLLASPGFDKRHGLVMIGGFNGFLSAISQNGPGTAVDWNVSLGGASITTTPTTTPDGAVTFATTDNNRLVALNSVTGAELWSASVCDLCPQGTEVSDPAVDDEGKVVVVGGALAGTKTKGINMTGGVIWTYPVGTSRKPPVFLPGAQTVVLVHSTGAVALNKTSGTLVWSWTAPPMTLGAPTLGGPPAKRLIALLGESTDGKSWMFALGTNGAEQWRVIIGDQVLRSRDNRCTFTPDNTMILVAGASGHVYGVDINGEVRWAYLIPGMSNTRLLSAPIVTSTQIFLAATNNSVFSLQYVPVSNKTLNMAEYINTSSDLSQLGALLTSMLPTIRAVLSQPGNMTFFAPSNDALNVFSDRIGSTPYALWTHNDAQHVFKYYMLGDVWKVYNFAAQQFIPTLLVDDPFVRLGPGARQPILIKNRGPENVEVDPTSDLLASISTADIRCSNGVIHVINTVILPPNRTTEVLNFWQYGNFAALINQNPANLVMFENTSGVTVFAPSDIAFAKASSWVPNVPRALNATLALYHVVPRLLYSKDLVNGMVLTTAAGDTLTVVVNGGGTFVTDGTMTANITLFDKLTTSGVIHGITEVLAPPLSAKRTIGDNIFFDRRLGRLTGLLAGAEYLGFVGSLAKAGPLTLYAPMDVSPRGAFSPKGNGFSYHVATGLHSTAPALGKQFFRSMLADPAYVQLQGQGQMIQYVTSGNITKPDLNIVAGLPTDPLTTTMILNAGAGVLCSNGYYVFVDKWIVPPSNLPTQLNTAGLTSLVAYANKAEVLAKLQNLSAITLFAPTNTAFAAQQFWADGLFKEALSTVIQYHAVQGVFYSTDLKDGQKLTTITGETLLVRIVNGTTSISSATSDGATVVLLDIQTANGVIHTVNNLMSPPSNGNVPILTNMAYRKDLSQITSRVANQPQFADLRLLLSNTSIAPRTVFIPNNAGFLAVALNDTEISDSVRYAIANGSFPTTSLGALQFLPSFLRNSPRVNLGPNVSQVLRVETSGHNFKVIYGWDENSTALLVDRDIKSSNGFLHVVNRVIRVPLPALGQLDLEGLDRMSALVVKANLQPVFEGTAVTIFAPRDEALQLVENWTNWVTTDLLAIALKYHVVRKLTYSPNLVPGTNLITVLGDVLVVERDSLGRLCLETAEGAQFLLTDRDLLISNGVVHQLAELIEPPVQSNSSLLVNLALQPAVYTLARLLTLPEFEVIRTYLDSTNVTLFAPSDRALAPLAAKMNLASAILPGYFPLMLNQTLWLMILPSPLVLSQGDTLSPTHAPTRKPGELDEGFEHDIPSTDWPADGGPLFVETLLTANLTFPNVVRLGGLNQNLKLEREPLSNETIYSVHSGPPHPNWTATIVRQDLETATGVLHIMDQLVSPPVPSSGALKLLTVEMSKLITPAPNSTHWIDSTDSLTVFATTDAAIVGARKLNDLVPETVLRRQTFAGVLTVSQLRAVASSPNKDKRKITMGSGDAIELSIDGDGILRIGQARLQNGDYLLSNGLAHVVDDLLVPANDNTVPWALILGIIGGCLLCFGLVFFGYKRWREHSSHFDFQRIPENKRGEYSS